jgi:hypothetical protein
MTDRRLSPAFEIKRAAVDDAGDADRDDTLTGGGSADWFLVI